MNPNELNDYYKPVATTKYVREVTEYQRAPGSAVYETEHKVTTYERNEPTRVEATAIYSSP